MTKTKQLLPPESYLPSAKVAGLWSVKGSLWRCTALTKGPPRLRRLQPEHGPVTRGGRRASHLYQCLLHGCPVGHPPSTLQDEVRVDVALGLAVLCQGLPLVQLLGAPRDKGFGAKAQ